MFSILDYLKMAAGIAAGLVLYHLYAVTIGYPSAVREARKGYVIQSELDASKAKAAKLERDILLGEQIRALADKAAEQLDIDSQKRQAADEEAIGKTSGGSTVTRFDLDSVERVRKPR